MKYMRSMSILTSVCLLFSMVTYADEIDFSGVDKEQNQLITSACSKDAVHSQCVKSGQSEKAGDGLLKCLHNAAIPLSNSCTQALKQSHDIQKQLNNLKLEMSEATDCDSDEAFRSKLHKAFDGGSDEMKAVIRHMFTALNQKNLCGDGISQTKDKPEGIR